MNPPANDTAAAELRAFLHYGFVPRAPRDLEERPWVHARPAPFVGDEETRLAAGQAALREACATDASRLHLVPVSGGIDSRLILAMLLEAGLRESILAVTFGLPGTLDFELGAAVARRAGVRHEAIDLSGLDLDEGMLVEGLAAGPPWVHAFEAHYNHLVARRFGKDAVIWSGIMANSLNGSRYRPDITTWEGACADFAGGLPASRTVRLTPPEYDPRSALPAEAPFEHPRLGPYEVLYLGYKYPARLDPCLLAPGLEYRTPFRERPWLDFTLSLGPAERAGEAFFRRLAVHCAPDLFRIPTKNLFGQTLGAPAWRVRLGHLRLRLPAKLRDRFPRLPLPRPRLLNYVDFDEELRDGRLAGLLTKQLDDLHRRGVIEALDVRELHAAHRSRRANHGEALMTLAVAELNLKANESRRR